MRIKPLLIVALILTTVGTSFSAELPSFFAAPVSTTLHRRLVGDDASVFLVIHGSAWKGHELTSLDGYNHFEGTLKRFAESHPGHLSVLVRYSKGDSKPSDPKEQLVVALKQECRAAGFKQVTILERYTSATWEDEIRPPIEYDEATGAVEQMEGNEYVQAFPVRTKLSKLFYPRDGCVVEILRVFDGREQEITPELDRAIRQAVKRLSFDEHEKEWLKFETRATNAGRDVIEKLFRNTNPIGIPPNASPALRERLLEDRKQQSISPGQLLANELGFSRVRYGVQPLGGSPESLIGKQAPDFSLPQLDGKKLQLKRFLSGRPGVVSFWGMACPPCRAEAPMLTELHNARGNTVAIVAVNGYAEAREEVAAFAKERGLTHPMVVNGSEAADDRYFVGAYPTTFFINKNGVVVSYLVGLESKEDLNARIDELLEP